MNVTDKSYDINGLAIRHARIMAGLSVDQLAFALGVSKQAVYSYESEDYYPSPGNLKKIAEITGVKSVDYFFRDPFTHLAIKLRQEDIEWLDLTMKLIPKLRSRSAVIRHLISNARDNNTEVKK